MDWNECLYFVQYGYFSWERDRGNEKAKIPNNCIAAGNPARVIRTDIAWSRKDNLSTDIGECGAEFIKCTENR